MKLIRFIFHAKIGLTNFGNYQNIKHSRNQKTKFCACDRFENKQTICKKILPSNLLHFFM